MLNPVLSTGGGEYASGPTIKNMVRGAAALALLIQHLGDDALTVLIGADVALMCGRLGMCLLEPHQRLAVAGVAGGYPNPACLQPLAYRQTDPTHSARDECDLSCHVTHDVAPSVTSSAYEPMTSPNRIAVMQVPEAGGHRPGRPLRTSRLHPVRRRDGPAPSRGAG